ncbi:hypothetical protein NQ317_017872 [Molorchus minor]|uniref:Uncharacterized protein n=1 Tax=Molorchus minor TaxID=1323400 RepID=A0ABQ9JB34_9CUCU|nr:hypothetical protein NQ317_017872 [Molorchus minor]
MEFLAVVNKPPKLSLCSVLLAIYDEEILIPYMLFFVLRYLISVLLFHPTSLVFLQYTDNYYMGQILRRIEIWNNIQGVPLKKKELCFVMTF